MKLIFLTIARDELAEIKRFYNRQQKGLGDTFQREAEAATKLILERPLAWQVEIEPTRRFVLNQFPYKMVYWCVPIKWSWLPSCTSIATPITG